jgi:hypothetical protein
VFGLHSASYFVVTKDDQTTCSRQLWVLAVGQGIFQGLMSPLDLAHGKPYFSSKT